MAAVSEPLGHQRPPASPARTVRHAATTGSRCRCWGGSREVNTAGAGGYERTPHHQNVPCSRSPQARVGDRLGGHCGHQASPHSRQRWRGQQSSMSVRPWCRQGHAEQGYEMSPFLASSVTCPTWARGSEMALAGVMRRENHGVRCKPLVDPGYATKEHQQLCHICQTAEERSHPRHRGASPLQDEQPPGGFPNKELTATSRKLLRGCSQPPPKLLQPEYSRPAVTFGYFTYIAQAQFISGIIW